MLDDLIHVIEKLQSRIVEHRAHLAGNEIRTRVSLIDPLLGALGWDVADPALVVPEYEVSGKRADYALMDPSGAPIVFLEAKRLGVDLASHRSQVLLYASEVGIRYPALTNGDQWELYDNLKMVPIDERRILQVSVSADSPYRCALELMLIWRHNVGSGDPVPVPTPLLETVDNATEPAPLPTPKPPPPKPPPSNGWVSLADFEAIRGNRPPPIIRFADGEETSISSWRALLTETCEWLVRQGHLTEARLPLSVEGTEWRRAKTESWIWKEPAESTGMKLQSKYRLSNGLIVETNHTAEYFAWKAKGILTMLGQDPAAVLLKTG